VSVVETRLASLIEQMPKEGIKAAVAQGIVERIREIVEAAQTAVKLVECLGNAKGSCKSEYCDPVCSRIFLVRQGDVVRLGKYRSNTIGVAIEPGRVEFATRDAKLIVESNGTVQARLLGLEETVDLSDVDEVYKNSYLLKRVIREVGGRIDVVVDDLRKCARQMALVC